VSPRRKYGFDLSEIKSSNESISKLVESIDRSINSNTFFLRFSSKLYEGFDQVDEVFYKIISSSEFSDAMYNSDWVGNYHENSSETDESGKHRLVRVPGNWVKEDATISSTEITRSNRVIIESGV
jgi:hypothetical protein